MSQNARENTLIKNVCRNYRFDFPTGWFRRAYPSAAHRLELYVVSNWSDIVRFSLLWQCGNSGNLHEGRILRSMDTTDRVALKFSQICDSTHANLSFLVKPSDIKFNLILFNIYIFFTFLKRWNQIYYNKLLFLPNFLLSVIFYLLKTVLLFKRIEITFFFKTIIISRFNRRIFLTVRVFFEYRYLFKWSFRY